MEDLRLNSHATLQNQSTQEIKREISKIQGEARNKVKELKKLLHSARLREMELTGKDPLSGKGRQFVIIDVIKRGET